MGLAPLVGATALAGRTIRRQFNYSIYGIEFSYFQDPVQIQAKSVLNRSLKQNIITDFHLVKQDLLK
jgi:hypothetical protein